MKTFVKCAKHIKQRDILNNNDVWARYEIGETMSVSNNVTDLPKGNCQFKIDSWKVWDVKLKF